MARHIKPSEISISPQQIIDAGQWSAALFMSYALSLSFFEAAPLIALRRTGCRSVVLLTDVEGYRVSLSEAGVNHVGRTYELNPGSVDGGIFHPKIMVLIGESGPRVVIGSGNLTFNGWGGNLEIIDYLNPRTAGHAVHTVADFLERIQTTPRVHSIWPNLETFVTACRGISTADDDGLTSFVHSLDRSIADQIVDFANNLGGATSITVVSPFFGSVDAVAELATKLSTNKVAALVPPVAPEYFPFSEAKSAGLQVQAVTAPIFSNDKRRLHAKIIEVVCRRGRLWFSGSVNATSPARRLMFSGQGSNERDKGIVSELIPAHRAWMALQARQLQRLSLESLLVWLEHQIMSEGGIADTPTLSAAANRLARRGGPGADTKTVGDFSSTISALGKSFGWPAAAAMKGKADIFDLMDKIEQAQKAKEYDRLPGLCLTGLGIASIVSNSLKELGERGGRDGTLGGPIDRLPLDQTAKRITDLADSPMNKLWDEILERWVLGQHVRWSVARSGDETQRLRLAVDEGGWVRLRSKMSGPFRPTRDRLATALALSADCGMLLRPQSGEPLYSLP